MKTIFNVFIIFLLHQILFGACPQMENAKGYYVNNIKFDTYNKARGYIKELKKKEDGFKKLEVLKLSRFKFTTKWIYSNEHGFFCVCPKCR